MKCVLVVSGDAPEFITVKACVLRVEARLTIIFFEGAGHLDHQSNNKGDIVGGPAPVGDAKITA